MSEKKTTGKQEHTLTLEDQAKLAQANAKKMEQGKIEARAPFAQVIVSKSCEVLTLEEYQRRMAEGR